MPHPFALAHRRLPQRRLTPIRRVALVVIALINLTAATCSTPSTQGGSPATATPATNSGSAWGLPFKTGTQVKLGVLGLHDDNFHGLSRFTLENAGLATSALDIVPEEQNSPTDVIPLAAGKILDVDATCHFVLVDHFNGEWVGYQHIDLNAQLKPGDPVDRTTAFATTAAPPPAPRACEHSDARHVHFAFLNLINGTSTTGTFVTMVGMTLCGHTISTSAPTQDAPHGGAIEGLADAPGQAFTVPNCPTSAGASASPSATSPAAQLEAPMLLSPPNGFVGTGQQVGNARWQAVPSAATYTIDQEPVPAGWDCSVLHSPLLLRQGITTTSGGFPVTAAGHYCWFVYAIDSSGHAGRGSTRWGFEIVG